MKISKSKLKKIIKEEFEKIHLNTSLMEDVFTEEEKEYWLQEFQKSEKYPKYELDVEPEKETESSPMPPEIGANNLKRFLNGILLADALGTSVLEEGDEEEQEREVAERSKVLSLIEEARWEKQNPGAFADSVNANPRLSFLTPYTEAELSAMSLYKVPGYNIGFAVKSDGDIVSVHNSTNIGGLGKALIKAAVKAGGSKLDHFDGFLSPFYDSMGFKEYERWKWDDQYAPKGWEYDNYGTPDVVLRKL